MSVPDHRGITGPKDPDIKIMDRGTGEEIIVEVSRMKPSDHQNLTSHTYHVIHHVLVREAMQLDPEAWKNILQPRHILPYAKIHRGIEKGELEGIVEQIRQLVERVRTGGEFDELIIPETIEVGITSYDDHDRAREWAASRGMRDHDLVEGPNIIRDEISRARRKLRDKLKQLPPDRPGIVVIPTSENLILFIHDSVEGIQWLAAAMAEEVEKYPQLLRAVMFHTFDDGREGPWSVDIGPHTLTRLIRCDGAVERSLTIRNSTCTYALAAETLEKVDSAFSQWIEDRPTSN